MKVFDPQIILFVADTERAAPFYAALCFVEDFRATEPDTAPVKIEMSLDGFGLRLALPGPGAQTHGLTPVTRGRRPRPRRKGSAGTAPVPGRQAARRLRRGPRRTSTPVGGAAALKPTSDRSSAAAGRPDSCRRNGS